MGLLSEKEGFQRMAVAKDILTPHEMKEIMAVADEKAKPGTVSGAKQISTIRRSKVHWLRKGDGYGWLYDRLWGVSKKLNQQHFHFDIKGFDTSIQVAKYESGDEGFYNWHMDNGEKNSRRKISLSVQLSDPADYSGGDLELFYTMQARKADKSRGAAVAFPSFVMHRVTPVTRGVRYSLVVWIAGPRWR